MPKRKRDPSVESTADSSDDGSSEGSLLPTKSKKQYQKAWEEFLAHIREHCSYPKSATTTRKPSESQYTSYIKALREKGLKPTTLWTYFSMLCTQHTLLHGESPGKKYPRLTQRLKKYSKEHVTKKATPFTAEQVEEFMKQPAETVEDMQTKALVAITYFGGLRCAELREIDVSQVRFSSDGSCMVEYQGAKKNAEAGQRCFCIPADAKDFASAVSAHFSNLKDSGLKKGPIARRCKRDKSGFADQPIGKNLLYLLPQVADALQLPPGNYTGHATGDHRSARKPQRCHRPQEYRSREIKKRTDR